VNCHQQQLKVTESSSIRLQHTAAAAAALVSDDDAQPPSGMTTLSF